MDVEEIVKALRCCGNTDTKIPDCEHCPLRSTRMCVKVMLEGAVNALETLQTKLTETTAERDALLKSFKVKPVGLEERGD